ncbi:MAG: LON peptidase substrate-binding domain-containing protein [Spirosomataceae bacterium]
MQPLPFFPLTLVVYPHESLNLLVFEPRYRQLISECVENGTTFGIPIFIDNKIKGYGTEVKVVQLSKRYEDNRMDIKTMGVRIFRIMDFQNPMPDKLYAGGDVEFIESDGLNDFLNPKLLSLTEEFYQVLKLNVDFLTHEYQPVMYRVAHKIGLSPAEEYKLVTIASEEERQQFLIQHLKSTMPVIKEIERTRDIIAMNGHFKNIDPINF